MNILRTIAAIGSLTAMLAMVPLADEAYAGDKRLAASPIPAKNPKAAPFPVILVLCRPYQTCPP
jgi:hypothetical protein